MATCIRRSTKWLIAFPLCMTRDCAAKKAAMIAVSMICRFLKSKPSISAISMKLLLKTEIPHPKGLCAFLDNNGACRIYNQRPYVCRTQGLPLHWIEERENGTEVAMRDICPINNPGTPVENLPEDLCWKIGPFEEQLARLQYDLDKGEIRRVKLRDLFAWQKNTAPDNGQCAPRPVITTQNVRTIIFRSSTSDMFSK